MGQRGGPPGLLPTDESAAPARNAHEYGDIDDGQPSPAERELENAAGSALAEGDEVAFGAAAERYRRRLHVHCYRMVGSFDDAEE